MDLKRTPLNAIDLELISNREFKSMISCYVCINCRKLALNPLKCCNSNCTAYFCEGCFKVNNDCCPGCQTKNSKKPISNELNELLRKIKFECLHKNKGCKSLIPLSDYQDHLNSKCEFSKENPNNQMNIQLSKVNNNNVNKSLEFQLEGKIL